LFIIYAPSQQLQGELQKQHRVDSGNYITDREKRKYNRLKASFGNSIVENYFLQYTKKKNKIIIRTRKTAINNKVVMRKPIKYIIVTAINLILVPFTC
jgi:hypothetical protein